MSKIKKSELLDIVREQGSAITNLLQRVTFLENPHLKHLDQSIFDGLDEKWRWAAFNTPSNSPVLFSVKPYESMRGGWYAVLGCDEYMILDELEGVYEYASNWQNSLIERDTAKELTGSELCRAMLARGDKYVMCKTSGTGEAEAMESKYPDVIQKYDWEFFYTPYKKRYAVPINNQGEPLSAAEAGF